jgi:phenylpyruvate tautomerase PptA (4-oxalocrotonate tautomerase family)
MPMLALQLHAAVALRLVAINTLKKLAQFKWLTRSVLIDRTHCCSRQCMSNFKQLHCMYTMLAKHMDNQMLTAACWRCSTWKWKQNTDVKCTYELETKKKKKLICTVTDSLCTTVGCSGLCVQKTIKKLTSATYVCTIGRVCRRFKPEPAPLMHVGDLLPLQQLHFCSQQCCISSSLAGVCEPTNTYGAHFCAVVHHHAHIDVFLLYSAVQ